MIVFRFWGQLSTTSTSSITGMISAASITPNQRLMFWILLNMLPISNPIAVANKAPLKAARDAQPQCTTIARLKNSTTPAPIKPYTSPAIAFPMTNWLLLAGETSSTSIVRVSFSSIIKYGTRIALVMIMESVRIIETMKGRPSASGVG